MKLEVHLLSHDDEPFLAWALRHYMALGATRVIVHDGGPTVTSPTEASPTAKAMKWNALAPACDVMIRQWDTGGQMNDELAMDLKNTCWLGTDADWVVVADADELLHAPGGFARALATYEALAAAIIKPHGFEMFSEAWFEAADYPLAQITRLVTFGAPDDKWYAKPILFSPKRVADSGFGVGAHHARPVLHDGRVLTVDDDFPKAFPELRLLHYHQIGPIERVGDRYDATTKRLALVNKINGWGKRPAGIVHAQEKRDRICPFLRKVVT